MLDTETDRSHPPLSPLLGVDIGSPRTHDNLAVFPLLAPDLAEGERLVHLSAFPGAD